MEMQPKPEEHQSREQSLIANVEEKNGGQFVEPNSNCCIYWIPQFLYSVNRAAYTPRLISIGLLHNGNKELMRMESQKERYRTSLKEKVGQHGLNELNTYIQSQEKSIRAHYSVTSNIKTEKSQKIILEDVIFIVELFRRKDLKTRKVLKTNDFLLESPMASYIAVDLLVVGNQLPYYLLKDLYSEAFPGDTPFFDLLKNFFKEHKFFKYVSFEKIPQEFAHFTDFLRFALLTGVQQKLESSDKDIVGLLPCATKLKRSGLKFERKDKSFLDIQFAKTQKYCKWMKWFETSEIQIPTLVIDHDTEILLRNLMVWESFHYPNDTHICSYANLMDHLINTAEDVDFLVEKGIIVNHVGDNETIANMFNRLCSHIVPGKSCYYEISQKMIEHYERPWNNFKTTLKSGYFNNPWTSTATVAAAFLLLLTTTQTIYSIIQVHQG